MASFDYDVVIVGSGFGGSVAGRLGTVRSGGDVRIHGPGALHKNETRNGPRSHGAGPHVLPYFQSAKKKSC